ncbi:Proton-dependent oligopeptide transporter family [Dillenia turbinata]|uniref:Proton-dependent oligopeptide transporter family n=1 Tax=Dillenia turbinata TaxID=194707 RepID=A0AAN8VRT1_9MAGN
MQIQEMVDPNLVTNGSVDYRGRTANKQTTGGWKASPFIISLTLLSSSSSSSSSSSFFSSVNEVAERSSFFPIATNMVQYLVLEMHHPIPTAATHVTDWMGAAYCLTLFGAFLADAYLGRFKTLIIFSTIYAAGAVLLTSAGSVDSLRPPPCTTRPCVPAQATWGQNAFLFVALALIALGTGGIKPCASSFGADQFDESDPKEAVKKYAFFNWFYFAINMGVVLGLTVLVYIQQQKGWGWGFGVPTVLVGISVLILAVGYKHYRHQKPTGSAFTRFAQVIVASLRNHFNGVKVGPTTELYEVQTQESDIFGARKISHTSQFRLLDKAAVITDPEEDTKNRWKLCTVTQVEEFKCMVRVIPIWLSNIIFSLSLAQLTTFFVSQARLTDRNLGPNFQIPPASVSTFGAINAVLLVPLYEKVMVPILRKYTGHHRGLTSLQRTGVGLVFNTLTFAVAAMVERKRLNYTNPSTMSVFWLVPQFYLIGVAEVFAYVGQMEFFYDEATDGTRSISSALLLAEIGVGSWLSTGIVKIVEHATGGIEKGWLRSNLNESRLDLYYWVLTVINVVNFFVYLVISYSYKGRHERRMKSVGDASSIDQMGGQNKEEQ